MIRRWFLILVCALVISVLFASLHSIALAAVGIPALQPPAVRRADAPHAAIINSYTQTSATGVAHVNCPTGYQVIGGGFVGTRDLNVFFNYKAQNGWTVKAKPYATPTPSITVYVLCAQWASLVQYRSYGFTVQSLQEYNAIMPCNSGETYIGGGYKINDARGRIYASRPYTTGWFVTGYNQAADPKTLTVMAICAPSAGVDTSAPSANVTIGPGAQTGKTLQCPINYNASGGGFDLQGVFWAVSTYPKSVTAWRSVAQSDHTGSTLQYTTYALCTHFH